MSSLTAPTGLLIGGEWQQTEKRIQVMDPATFTVLADGGMSDIEILRWLHTPDDTLPVPGAPIDAIHAGFKTEVRRRAMEEAF